MLPAMRALVLFTVMLGASGALATGQAAGDAPPPAPVQWELVQPDSAYPEVQLKPLGVLIPELQVARFGTRLALASLDDAPAAEQPTVEGDEAVAPAEGEEGAAPPVVETEDLSRFPRVRGVHEESRVFWYAAGASALTSLVVRVLAFLPAVIGGLLIIGVNVAVGPAATLALVVGLIVGLSAVDAGLAALAGSLVFDSLSDFYDSSFFAAFGGQFLGNAAALGVSGLTVGFGLALILGTTILTQFIGEGITIGFTVLSFFGLIPAIVIGFFASVALPALVGAWAISMSAQPREGFKIDPNWAPLAPRVERQRAPRGDREVALFWPRLVLPGT